MLEAVGRWIGEYFFAMLDQNGSLTGREAADGGG